MKRIVDVSVVIPAYNAENYIEDCLKSVISQTVEPKEIIVINDGSTDSTLSLVNEYAIKFPNLKCISKDNAGLSEARNTGIKTSTCEYIAFLDSDDMWHPAKLEKQLELFQITSEELGLVYSAYELCDEKGLAYQGNITAPYIKGNILSFLIEKGNLISGSGSGVLVKKNIFEEVGFFDSNLSFAEDLDMWIRIAEKYQVDFVNEVLVVIRTHTKSMQAQYTSHYSRFMANWPIYSKHSTYFTTKRNLKKIRFDAANASINSLIRGATSYHGVNTLSHAKELQLGEFPLFNNWFIFSFSIVDNVFRRGLYKFVITVKKLFAKD